LVWSFVDIVAKGGNLLLNVGPRGEDATIAEAQLRRLDWLAELTSARGEAIFATRPWTTPASGAGDDGEVRYSARDRDVFAFVRPANGAVALAPPVVLRDVRPTSTTEVREVGGEIVAYETTSDGLVVRSTRTVTGEDPLVLALRDVTP